jgi:glycosyltransferase involved in cell wall biosynthesis
MSAVPLVSCLMVTRNRAALARRAVLCFVRQTWPNRELVIVDDGDEDYEPMLAPFRLRARIVYHRVPPAPARTLGALRNMSLGCTEAPFCAQWDDDEWYHPRRIARQMQCLTERSADAVVLKWTLMHLDRPGYRDHLARVDCSRGTPGTILHRSTDLRYPERPRSEDSAFLVDWQRIGEVAVMGRESSHLFVRCYHGANTWDLGHFERRLRRTPVDRARAWRARFVDRDIRAHPAFRLQPSERTTALRFLADSRELGLLSCHEPELGLLSCHEPSLHATR